MDSLEGLLETVQWRVLADIQSCAGVPASVARLHIFLPEGLVTISKSKEVWVNGRSGAFPVTSGILSASAQDNSVSIQIGTDLKIEFSSSGSISIRVLEGLSEVVCGACGNFNGSSCSGIKCQAKETCRIVNGKPVCVPDSGAYCHAVGDPHYRTFDGYFYDFQGTCTYTIAKTCSNDSNLPYFNIEAKNENRGNTRVSYVSFVNVQVYEHTISLVRSEYAVVRVNNQRQRLPINLNNGQVQLYQSGSSIIIETDFSLRVYYDWNALLKVYITSSFFGRVCGLCGNYNGNFSDELMTSDGVQAPNLVSFGKSWKVEDGDRFCWHNCNGECKTCPLGTQQFYAGEQSCGLLSKVLDGPFFPCHSVIDPKTYVDNCVYDLCMNSGSKQTLCQSLKTYAEACQQSKVEIREWRSLIGCPMQCPANSEYKLCSKACPATCNDATPSVCADYCVESCQCIEGYVLYEGKCIPKASQSDL
ncbi:IgGFc-binding protein-like [Pyxicephalus adspersus]|uniref:IgGFc-binding protein-like n=1 Tax=Pyxicephalus adspersus TaxID=30357 RepID=UPI003B5BCCAF